MGGAIVQGQDASSSWPMKGSAKTADCRSWAQVPTQADITANTPVGGHQPGHPEPAGTQSLGHAAGQRLGNETFTTPFSNNSDNLIVKVDQHLNLFSAGDLLTGRYFYSHGTQSFPLGMLYTGSSAPGYNTYTPTHVNIVSLSYTSVPRNEPDRRNPRRLQPLPAAVPAAGHRPSIPTAIGLNTLPDPALEPQATWRMTPACRPSTWAGLQPDRRDQQRRARPHRHQLPALRQRLASPRASTTSRPATSGGAPSSTALSTAATAASWSSTRWPTSWPAPLTAAVRPPAVARATPTRTAAAPTSRIPGKASKHDHRELRRALGLLRRGGRKEPPVQPVQRQHQLAGAGGHRRRSFDALSQGLQQLRAAHQPGGRPAGQRQAGDAHRRGHLLRRRLAGLLCGQPAVEHLRGAGRTGVQQHSVLLLAGLADSERHGDLRPAPTVRTAAFTVSQANCHAALRLLQPEHRVAADQEDRRAGRLRGLAGPPPLPLPRPQPVQQRGGYGG